MVKKLNDIKGYHLDIKGKGHVLKLSSIKGNGAIYITMQSDRINNCMINIGYDNIINRTLSLVYYSGGNRSSGGHITIGNNNIFNGDVSITAPGNHESGVTIGDSNLFARTYIRGFNDHLIFEINTYEDFSHEKGIHINNNIWFCEDVLVLDKSIIQSNCVIGTRALVNKAFNDEFCLIAGIPAKVMKKNIMWNISCGKKFMKLNDPLNLYNT